MQRRGGGEEVLGSKMSLPEFLLMNPAAYQFDYIICELSDGKWTEGVQREHKDCPRAVSCV